MSYGRIERGPMGADVLGTNFTQIHNGAVRHTELSWNARGILTWMLSHKQGFGISVPAIVAAGPLGKKGVYAALKELEDNLYLKRKQEQDPKTKQFTVMVYLVTDIPNGATISIPSPWENEESSSSEPVTHKGKAAQTDTKDKTSEVTLFRDPPERHTPERRAAQEPRKKTIFEEDHAFGASSPAGAEDESSSSPSPLQAQTDDQAIKTEDEEEDTSFGGKDGTHPSLAGGLVPDDFFEEQYFGDDDQEPEPVCAQIDPERVLRALPWPGDVEPRGRDRQDILEALAPLLEGGWTEDQILGLFHGTTWGKITTPFRFVLSQLKKQEGCTDGSTGSEKEVVRIERERAQQLKEIAACPRCDEYGFTRGTSSRGAIWCGHGDMNLRRKLELAKDPQIMRTAQEFIAAAEASRAG